MIGVPRPGAISPAGNRQQRSWDSRHKKTHAWRRRASHVAPLNSLTIPDKQIDTSWLSSWPRALARGHTFNFQQVTGTFQQLVDREWLMHEIISTDRSQVRNLVLLDHAGNTNDLH